MYYELIIIGGGPAGMTAGIYAARQKLNTLLITKDFGGQVSLKAVAIENYPGFYRISGEELIQKFENHLKKQKIDIEMDEVIKLTKTDSKFLVLTKKKKKIETKAIIVASGADPRPLEVAGEKKFIGKGVSYCVTCDGPLFEDKTVAIVGGGNAGFEAAIFLAKYAKKIYILEYAPNIMADETSQGKVKKTGKVEIITQVALQEIKGKEFVDSVVYQDMGTKKISKLLVDGVFVEIGSQPATSFLRDLVDFNKRDEIKVDFETYQTKTPGLFAVGDVNIGKSKQIVTACGEGSKAAIAAYDYIEHYDK